MSAGRWLALVLAGAAAVASSAWLLRRQEADVLRREIELLRHQERALSGLRAEHTRLQELQLPASEMDRLRNDRSALLRLRAEIEQLKDRAGIRSLPAETRPR